MKDLGNGGQRRTVSWGMILRLWRLLNHPIYSRPRPVRCPAVLAAERARLDALLSRKWLGERTERINDLTAAARTEWDAERLRDLLDRLEAELEAEDQAARAW